ncbi:iron complex outermembrane recepter protein/vitamin B12 transporter [Granulicella pectinivorans]|uniref:Iron complex outermembrane recepter protein/vitamin B12 transporter n=1 Tax=Granulicella pectinivorans TaxID=474950 RepID=A0A1I6MGS9_9BACT|nr:TonB-dependent receptor plug domain-containing protein [Granulicella pectinivorans]SFS14831.1 iron complex outermembrane recepter protein/vitamin B12 transporter [Granulicella pectinivorans]
MAVGITRPDGSFEIRSAQSGRFVLFTAGGVSKTQLQPNISHDFYGGATDVVLRDVTLEATTLNETVTVTATGLPTPIQQLTAPVSFVSRDDLAYRTGLLDELRQSPGVAIVQSGQMGGVASLFVRGGNSDSNKVLIDGIPAEDVGGRFDLGLVSSTGLSNVGNNGPSAELYRGPNSALFGSDALASVLNLSTPRGTATSPVFTYSGDGGNFHTYRNEVTLSGTRSRYDYFTALSRLDSSNALPLDRFHAVTEAANLGASLTASTQARFTIRNTTSVQGVPGAHDFLGLSADQKQADQNLYSGATLENRTAGNWHNLVRYGIARKREQFNIFSNAGTYDPTQFAYVGPSLTITGANGYKVTGSSPITYAGSAPSRYDQVSNRDELYYQSDYSFGRHVSTLFGFRYENERGAYRYPLYATDQSLQRTNFQFTGQIQGDLLARLFFSLGGAIEKNHLYGLRGTPRLGLAFVPVRPGPRPFHGTRLRANFSRGVQEPSLAVQFSSLYGTLLAANDTADIAAYHVRPPNAEESRTYDVGIDQNIFSTALILKAGYFHNQFDHQYEYVDSSALQQYFGITTASTIPGLYGAYTNSLTFRAQGAETELQYQPRSRLFLHFGYTYLAPLVERSFSTDALQVHGATTNPLFPSITIGGSSPLVGQRPFRRPPNTGFFAVQYTGKRWTTAFKGAMSGKSDDSTFLATPLLLPNRNLDHGYAKLDLGLGYQWTQHLAAFTQLDNLLSQQHIGPIGYPGLPFTIRAGFKFRIGGE